MKKILLVLLVLIVEITTRKLVFVQNLFRHGARYPIFLNSDDFTSEPSIANNVGELTTQGKNMHYMLGKILYKKYWKALFQGTDAEYKVDHKQIYVKSTNVNRTIESVQSQLRGWFEALPTLKLKSQDLQYSLPAFENLTDYLDLSYTEDGWEVFNELPKYHSIPIHTGLGDEDVSSSNPYDEGDFLLKYDKLNCPKQVDWTQQNYNSQTGKDITSLPEVKQAISKLSEAFPSQTVTFQNAYKFIDNYICMQYLGEPTLKIFADPKFEKTFRYVKEVSMYISLFFQPIQYRTTATNLFENIVGNLKAAIKGTGPKLILYSAHDTTVGMTLATFNLTNVNCINDKYLRDLPNEETCASDYPRFASNFIIELYKEDNGTYSFSIVFNNIQRRIPFCNWQFFCPVQKFYEWVDSWKIDDPNKQCGIEDEFKVKLQTMKKQSMNFYVVIAILVGIVIILMVWIISNCIKHRKQKKEREGYVQNFEEKQLGQNKNHEIEPTYALKD